jgi:predicted DNA-binding antitoxin AbrB/MazE fold protein
MTCVRLFGVSLMAITIEAVYENGFLKPAEPLPFQEHEKVRITVHSETSPLLQAYGIMGFTGSAELADYFALSPDLDFPPPAVDP